MDNGCHSGWCFARLAEKDTCPCRQGANRNERRVDLLGAHNRTVYPSAEELASRRERAWAKAYETQALEYANARKLNGIK